MFPKASKQGKAAKQENALLGLGEIWNLKHSDKEPYKLHGKPRLNGGDSELILVAKDKLCSPNQTFKALVPGVLSRRRIVGHLTSVDIRLIVLVVCRHGA